MTMSTSRGPSSPSDGPPFYGMPIPQQFLSDDEKTFQHDESLPSLPVPPLQQTLSKYLDSGMKCAVLIKHIANHCKLFGVLGASLDLHITTLTLSLIVTLTLQPYPNPNPTNSNATDPNHAAPNPNCNPDRQI